MCVFTSLTVALARRLRRLAEQRGFYLCNAAFGRITDAQAGTAVPVDCDDERGVFAALGLPYVEPARRCY